jgi:hypothetical protein
MGNNKRKSGFEIDGMFAPFHKFMQLFRFYSALDIYHFPYWGKLFESL